MSEWGCKKQTQGQTQTQVQEGNGMLQETEG